MADTAMVFEIKYRLDICMQISELTNKVNFFMLITLTPWWFDQVLFCTVILNNREDHTKKIVSKCSDYAQNGNKCVVHLYNTFVIET